MVWPRPARPPVTKSGSTYFPNQKQVWVCSPHIHPALEGVIGPHLDHQRCPSCWPSYPTPAALREAGHTKVETLLRKHALRAGKCWVIEVFAALDEQSVVVSGTGAAGIIRPQPAQTPAQTLPPAPTSWNRSRPSRKATLFTSF